MLFLGGLSANQKEHSLIPGSFSLCAEASLGETLNPELPRCIHPAPDNDSCGWKKSLFQLKSMGKQLSVLTSLNTFLMSSWTQSLILSHTE